MKYSAKIENCNSTKHSKNARNSKFDASKISEIEKLTEGVGAPAGFLGLPLGLWEAGAGEVICWKSESWSLFSEESSWKNMGNIQNCYFWKALKM